MNNPNTVTLRISQLSSSNQNPGHINLGQMAKNKPSQELVFDQKERMDYVKGFGKRKQERKERAKLKAEEREREIRKLLRQKRREALKRAREGNEDKSNTSTK